MAKATTLRDIAKEVNLSVATVSMALNQSSGYERISEKTTRIIKEAAERLDYHPIVTSQSMRGQKSYLVAFAVPDINHPFAPQLINGVGEALREAGYQMILLDFTNNTVEESMCQIRQLKCHDVEGIIIHSMGREYAGSIGEIMPCVYLDEKTFFPCVWFDAQGATSQLVEHFIAQGIRDIAYIGSSDDIDTYVEREKGVMLGMLREGIMSDLQNICRVPATREGGMEAFEWLRKQERLPRAVIVYTDVVAHVLIMELHRAGIKVPEEIAIASVDDVPLSALMYPTLTCARVPAEEMGRRAVSMIIRLLDGENIGYCETLPVEIHVRESSVIKKYNGE